MRPDRQVDRPRAAMTAAFASAGIMIGTYAARTPSMKGDLDLTDGDLGWAATVVGLSAIAAMRLAPALTRRLGSGRVVYGAALALPLALAANGLVTSFWQLMVVQVFFGGSQGVFDVAANSHAVGLEHRTGRPLMNTCHAAWSIGSLSGALIGAAVADSLPRSVHQSILAVLLVVTVAALCRVLISDRMSDGVSDGAAAPAPARARLPWRPQLLLLGAIGAIAMTAEAGVVNWSAVLLHDHLAASLGVAALATFCFTGFQASGRLVGDRLLARYSRVALIRVGTLVAAAGMTIIVTSGSAVAALVGYAVLGIGSATSLPMLFGLAGRLETDPDASATAVSRFGMVTYAGLLVSPAVIGWSADHIGLTRTLAVLVPAFLLAAATVGLGAPRPAVGAGADSRTDAGTAPDAEAGSPGGSF